MFTRTRFALSAMLLALTGASVSLPALGAELAENRVAVIIDISGSFKGKQAEAIGSTAKMIEGMADVKLKRWEPAKDKIILISLDAMPEVIWSGSLQDLKKLDEESWKGVFEKRTDYVKCTDVTKAFKLALDELDKDAGPKTFKYLFVYSDLIHEPPTDAICNCAPIDKKTPVPTDIPWGDMKQVRVAVFWVPGQQKYVWSKAIEEHGLTSSFNLYASESETKEILPPPRPENKPTDQEVLATREKVKSWLSSVGKVAKMLAASLIGILLLCFAGMAVSSRFRRLRPQEPANGNGQSRPRPIQNHGPQSNQRHPHAPVRRPQPARPAPPRR